MSDQSPDNQQAPSGERGEPRLNIGAVERATGIPSSTLRTWERRYGFPDPERTESGHRRYAPSIVGRLRLVSRALDHGYRPSQVVPLPARELEELVEPTQKPASSSPSADTDDVHGPEWLEEWMHEIATLDGDALTAAFREAWTRQGGLRFIEERIVPLLDRLGEAWRNGEIGIAHEHQASEQIRDFLSSKWRPLSERSAGPSAVCATLPGEDHVLGIHIVSTVLAMAGCHIVFLGGNTPPGELLQAARLETTGLVAVSFSQHYDPRVAASSLADLADRLPESVDLIAGGGGAPESLQGVRTFSDLDSLYDWALALAHPAGTIQP